MILEILNLPHVHQNMVHVTFSEYWKLTPIGENNVNHEINVLHVCILST